MLFSGISKFWYFFAFASTISCATRLEPTMIYYDSSASRQTGDEIIVTQEGVWGFELQHVCKTRCRYTCRTGPISKSQFEELANIDWQFLRETQFIIDEPIPDEQFAHLEVYENGKIVGQHLPNSQFVNNARAMEAANRIEKFYIGTELSLCKSSHPFNNFRPMAEKAEWYFHYESRSVDPEEWISRSPYFSLVGLHAFAFKHGQSDEFECSLHPTVDPTDLKECEN